MKKVVLIFLIGLFWCSVVFAAPITLLCINDKSGDKWKVTIDLNKKTIIMGEGSVPKTIVLDGNKVIMYGTGWNIFLDRETGVMYYTYQDMDGSGLKFQYLTCKKADKLF